MIENDARIRKQWLAIWILSLLGSIVATILQLFKLGAAYPHLYIFAGSALFSVGVFSAISYRCIYKKPGTKFLTFLLVMSVYGLVSTPIFYLTGNSPIVPYASFYLVASEFINALWLIACWRMRKVNKRLQTSQS